MLGRILYPLFEECATYTVDPYWREIFENCARGKFPKNTKFDAATSTFHIKTAKTNDVFAIPNDSLNAFKIITNVLRDKAKLRSSRDLQLTKEEMDIVRQGHDCEINDDWKKIKNKSTKEYLLVEFAQHLRKQYQLTASTATKILSSLNLAFQLKSLTPNDVEMLNGRITRIHGFEINENRKISIRSIPSANTRSSDATVTLSDKYTNAIDRYVRDYNKKKSRIDV